MRRAKVPRAWVLSGLRVLGPPGPCPCVSCPRLPGQDTLSSQSFGTELPLVDHQVEQHNIFHNEVKAIGPHLAKVCACGEG